MLDPVFQVDIIDILIRFLFFKIGMSADVAKMYRGVELNEKHRYNYRLLWSLHLEQFHSWTDSTIVLN